MRDLPVASSPASLHTQSGFKYKVIQLRDKHNFANTLKDTLGHSASSHLYVDICELLIKPSCCSKVQQGHLAMDKSICITVSTTQVQPDLKKTYDVFRKLSWLESLSTAAQHPPNCFIA